MGNQQQSTHEVFKTVIGFPRIEVSNFGNVRSSNGKPRYVRINKQGYVTTQAKIAGKVHTLKVHRLVAELFLDPPSQELVEKCSQEHWGVVLVKHLDNDKTNNHYRNLAWDDLEGNTKQAWGDGLIQGLKGSANGRATITEELVHRMCSDFQDGMQPSAAVEKYGVTRSQATKIRAGIQWKHVWSQYDIKVRRRG